MIARSAKVVILEVCSQYILRLKAVREGDDITLPLSIIHEKVRQLIKELFSCERPEFGKVDIWESISYQTKKKFNFNLDSDDLLSIHLPRLLQTVMRLLNIKTQKPIREVDFSRIDEYLSDFDMQPVVKPGNSSSIGLESAEDLRPLSLNLNLS